MTARSTALIMLTVVTPWLSLACDPPPPHCTRLCDRVYYAEETHADDTCGGLVTTQRDAEGECRDACHAAWDDTSNETKPAVKRCIDCIIKYTPKLPEWDQVKTAADVQCRDLCTDEADYNGSWQYFYTDFHNALTFEVEPCPPYFPPPVPGADAGLTDAGTL